MTCRSPIYPPSFELKSPTPTKRFIVPPAKIATTASSCYCRLLISLCTHTTAMRGSRNRGGFERGDVIGEPRSRSTSFDQHHFRSHVASPGSTPSRGGRRRLEGRSVPRAGAEEPAVTSDGSTIFALSESENVTGLGRVRRRIRANGLLCVQELGLLSLIHI